MRILRLGIATILGVGWATGAAALSAAPPATKPAAGRDWGPAKAGLQLSLAVQGPIRGGGAVKLDLAVRNVGAAPVTLAATKDVFGWLLVVYGREEAWTTERFHPARDMPGWPAELAGGKEIPLPAMDAAGADVFSAAKRRDVYTAYLQGDRAAKLPAPDGKLSGKLAAGKARAQFTLVIPRGAEGPLVLGSNVLLLEVAAPAWSGLSEEARKQQAAKLIQQFDKDAWAAQAAHGQAVEVGPPVVPYLIEAVRSRGRPDYSRLWLATALADIRCPESAGELRRLLDDPSGGIRSVVAYHGVKQLSKELDAAILKRMAAETDGGVLSYAVVGFLVHRRQVPEPLLKASLDSPDPKVRNASISALKGQASDVNVSRLAELTGDADERIRSAAARALGSMGRGGNAVIAALIRALQEPGDNARQAIAEALGKLTGRDGPYDPRATAVAKDKVLKDWKDWWAKKAADAPPM